MVTYRNTDAPTGLEDSSITGPRETADAGASLVIDVDAHKVRGIVFDSVEGEARFVASAQVMSTVGPPIGDLPTAIREVVAILEGQTGTRLNAEPGKDSHLGPFAVTGFPVAPLSVAIVPTGQQSLTPALAAMGRATSSTIHVMTDAVRTEDGVLSSTLLEGRLRGIRPDIVVLLEGDRAQSEWASAVGTFTNLIADGSIQLLIVLASEEFQQYLVQALGEDANMTGLDPSQYEPHEVAMALETELAEMYQQRVNADGRFGLARDLHFVSRLRGGDLATRYIARRLERNVVSVDVSAGTSINWSTLHAGGSLARPDLDVHANVRSLLANDLDRVRSLLPFEMSREELTNWILNRATRSRVESALWRDQIVESVLLSGVVAQSWSNLQGVASDQIDLIVAGSGFCFQGDPALGVLSVINGFQPAPLGGVVQVLLDPDCLLWASGAIGDQSPAVAADVVEHDLLVPAATVVVVEGAGAEGQPAVTGKLTYEDGEAVDFSVTYGSLARLPLGEGDKATLVMTCEPGFAVGGSNPGEQIQFGPDEGFEGGEVGVIIDARGRPMAEFADESAARDAVRRWYADLNIKV